MQVITITGYRRPELFKALLETVLTNDLAGWSINIQLEPSDREAAFHAIADELLQGIPHSIVTNDRVLGIRENPYHLLERTFAAGAKLVLYLEEDLLIGQDATRLACWYARNHRPEWMMLSLLSGGCGSAGFISDPRHSNLLFPGKCFNSLGFACRAEEWAAHLRDAWMTDLPVNRDFNGEPAPGWDWAIYHHLIRSPDLYSLQPAAARANHNGRYGGVHCDAAWHDLAFEGLELAMPVASTTDYVVRDPAALPASVRRQALMWQQVNAGLSLLGRITVETISLRSQRDHWHGMSIWQRLGRVFRP